MAKCKITNRWMDSIESAGVGIASPKGGHLFIRKLDVDLVSDTQWELVRKCAFHTEPEIELSVEEMSELLAAVKASKGIYSLGKRSMTRLENVAAPQNNKVPQQKSYMQRNAERLNRIATTNQSTLQGCCPNCSQRGMKVKHHGTWAGYYCMACSKGGSITLKK
jgi:hypothetical protein